MTRCFLKARPDEYDTVGKVNYLVRWARSKVGKDHAKGTIRMVDESTDYFIAYFKALKQRIEDVKHTPMKTVQRRQVDRAVAYLLLCMGDMITLLDRAGYDWSRGSN